MSGSGLRSIVKTIDNSQMSNLLSEGNALQGHTRHDSEAAFKMLLRQWRKGAPQSDPCYGCDTEQIFP